MNQDPQVKVNLEAGTAEIIMPAEPKAIAEHAMVADATQTPEAGKIVEGYLGVGANSDKVGYVESIDEKTGKPRIKILDREEATARAEELKANMLTAAEQIDESRPSRLRKYTETLKGVRTSKVGQAAVGAVLSLGLIGSGAAVAGAEEKTPASHTQEQFDAGHSPYKTQETQEANTFPQSAVVEQERYEQMLKKQYAEDDKLSTFDGKNKVSEKAFGESPLVEGDAFATWEKGMDQLNHNSAAQAHVMWSLPEALKQELRIDGQRLSDLSTEQIQKIFDTNLQARDTLVGEVTDMIEDGDVSLEMVTKNTAYRSYHIQVDEDGKKHVIETPYLPFAERHVLILGYAGDTGDLNVECGFQGRSDIAPEQVAAVIAAAAVATQAPSQSATPETPQSPEAPEDETTPPHETTPPVEEENPPTTHVPEEEEEGEEEEPEEEKPGKNADLDPESQGNNKPGHGGQAPPVTEEAGPPAVEIGEGGSEDPTNIPEIIAPEADDTTAEEVIEEAAETGKPVEDINGNPATPGVDNGLPENANPDGADEEGRADGTITQ